MALGKPGTVVEGIENADIGPDRRLSGFVRGGTAQKNTIKDHIGNQAMENGNGPLYKRFKVRTLHMTLLCPLLFSSLCGMTKHFLP